MKHTIYRNGNLYDRLNPITHSVHLLAIGLAEEYRGDTFTVEDEHGEEYYSIKVSDKRAEKPTGPFEPCDPHFYELITHCCVCRLPRGEGDRQLFAKQPIPLPPHQ